MPGKLLHRCQIDGCKLAATIDLQLELQPVAFVQRWHAGTFNRADVNERVGLAIIALNKAEALHCIEELHRPRCLFTGQLPLRATCATATGCTRACIAIAWWAAIFNRHGLAVDLQIGRRNAATAINQREPQRLPFGQAGQAGLFDRTDVHEHIFAAVITDDKAEPLLAIEKLDDPGAFTNDLGGHAASSAAATGRTAKAAAAAKTAASTAAAEPITAATAAAAEPVATAAEAITTATKTVTTTKAAIESALAETIALVFATPATIAAAPFIETHALFVFPVRP